MISNKAQDNKEAIGKRIQEARIKKGLTQAQLGEMIGIKEIGIRQYEIGRNKPREDRLREIAKALEVDYLYLLIGNNEQHRNASGYTIQNRIRTIMGEKVISSKKLAKDIDCPVDYLNKVLDGQTPIDTSFLKKISHALSVNYRWICTGYDMTDEQILNQYNELPNKKEITYADIYGFGKLLKKVRETSILAVDQIAMLVDIDKGMLYDIEKGNELIDYSTLFNICRLLQINAFTITENDLNRLSNSYLNKSIKMVDDIAELNGKQQLSELYNYIGNLIK